MNIYPLNYKQEFLLHYGVLGMKWGIRKKYEYHSRNAAATRAKAGVISKKATQKSDKSLSVYRSRSLSSRLGGHLAGVVGMAIMKDFRRAGWSGERLMRVYKNTPKRILAIKLGLIGAKAIAETMFKDALAKSVQRRYTDAGKRTGRYTPGQVTKEEVILGTRRIVRASLFVANFINMGLRMGDLRSSSGSRSGPFENLGQQILSDGNVIDLKFKD